LSDRIRRDIQTRLEQLLHEVEKLKRALAALDPVHERSKPTRASSASETRKRPRTATTRRASSTRSGARATGGATRTAILEGLAKSGEPMTAGELAAATGLGRGTISTTLSKLSQSGVVVKADRGYRLPDASPTSN
jgi:DNA-binding transcriptional ArsR family regulator